MEAGYARTRSRLAVEAVVWLLAGGAVYALSRAAPARLGVLIAVLVGLGAVAYVAGHPLGSVRVLLVGLPFSVYGAAALYRLGVPVSMVRPLRFWPEVILAGLALAALVAQHHHGWRFDALDVVAAAYVCLGTAYLLIPRILAHGAPGAGLGFYARELGWRSDVMYVAVPLIARRLMGGGEDLDRLLRWLVGTGAVVAGLGVSELLDSAAWNHLAAGTLQVPTYQANVLHALPAGHPLTDVRVFGRIGSHSFVRVGSVLDYESLAFYLAVALIAAVALTRRGRAGRWMPVATGLIGLGLFATQTRSGILAGVVGVAVLLAGRQPVNRIRGRRARALVAAAAGLAALVVAARLGSRLAGDRTSDSVHLSGFHRGLQVMTDHPGGQGLATAAGGGQLAAAKGLGANLVVSEDQWLQIGMQLGWAGLAAYAGTFLLIIRGLGAAVRRRPTAMAAPILVAAFLGVVVGGTFLQPFINPTVSLTLFLLAGLAIGPPGPVAGMVETRPGTLSAP